MYDERSTPESYNYGYTSTTDPYHPSQSHSLTPSPSPSPPPLPTYPPSLFCRAKYPYTAQDASALTFTTGSIIEVLTRQESGWWDGMLGDERGWFPSNYVEVISEEEAEREWGEREREMEREMEVQGEMEMGREWGEREGWEREVDMGHALISASASSSSSSATDEWLAQALSSGSKSGSREREGRRERGRERERESASDFWMPQVASNGQIFYINTKTGEQSRDLPLEAEDVGVDDDEEEEEEGYYHHHHQEGERVNGEYGEGEGENGSGNPTSMFGSNSHSHLHPNAHTPSSYPSTPEPWIKRLADDGLSYYYLNTLDGSVQWDRPSPVPGFSEGYSANTPTTAVPRRRGREGSLETETETMTITDVDISNHSHPSSSEGTFIELDPNPNPNTNPNHSTKSLSQPHLTLPSSLPSPLLQSQLKLSSHLKLSSQLSSQLRAGLVPPPLTGDHPMEMIRRAREAIEGVVRRLSFTSTSIPTSGFTSTFTSTPIPTSTLIHTLIEHVILTLRNLLYICSSGSGSGSGTGTGTGGDRGLDLLDMGIVKGGKAVLDRFLDQSSLVSELNSNLNLKATNNSKTTNNSTSTSTPTSNPNPNPLKPAQRKLTATLSRLVLSARAVEYEDGDGDGEVDVNGDGGGDTTQNTIQSSPQSSIQTTPQTRETLDRIRGDAIELGKALDGYAKEVERVFGFGDGGDVGSIIGSTGTTRRKRLYAVFDPAGLGLGMLGAGRAG
ncbi:hypothetical protein GGU10DRAFT_320569, partial [Lentinula aff. detonsa]